MPSINVLEPIEWDGEDFTISLNRTKEQCTAFIQRMHVT